MISLSPKSDQFSTLIEVGHLLVCVSRAGDSEALIAACWAIVPGPTDPLGPLHPPLALSPHVHCHQ